MVEPSVDAVWAWIVEQQGVMLAVLSLVGSWYLGRLLVRLFGRRVSRRFQRPSVTRTVLRLIRTGSLTVGILAALTFLGVPITGLALSVTVFSAVLGLVLAPIVGSVINGVFVLADQPYEIGDMIEITDRDQRGFVEDITLRYTKVFTLDNTFLVIPNSAMRDRDVVNYSAEDERTRLSLTMGVTYEGDLAKARRIMEEAATEVEEVIAGGPDIRIGSARYPASPTAYIQTFGDHGVHLQLRYWVREPYRLPALKSKVQTQIWDRLEEADDVEIAYPHSHLVFDETSGTARVSLQDERPGRPVSRRQRAGREEAAEKVGGETGQEGTVQEETGQEGTRRPGADQPTQRRDQDEP